MKRYFCNPIFCCPIDRKNRDSYYSGWDRNTFMRRNFSPTPVSYSHAMNFLGNQPNDWRETPRGVALQIVRDRLASGALC